MRLFRILLETIAFALLVAVAALQFRMVDFDLPQREKQEDLKLRDYVISHDLEYVKKELIALQKDSWETYTWHSRRAQTSLILVSLAALAFGLSRLGRRQRQTS